MSKKKEVENAHVRIELNEEGGIKVDTNLTALGAIHVMTDAIQVIIRKTLENNASPEVEEQQQ